MPTYVVVASDVELGWRLHQRRRALETLRVGLLAIGVLEENSVAAADRHLAIAQRIPRKTQGAGAGLNRCPFKQPRGTAAHAALHYAIERGCRRRENERALLPGGIAGHVDLRSDGRVVGQGIPVVNQMVLLPESPEQTDAQAQIQG